MTTTALTPVPHPSRAGARLRAEERRSRLARIVHLGWTEARMAEHLGIPASTLHYDLQALRKQWYAATFEDTNATIAKDCALLGYAMQCLIPGVEAGNAKAVEALAKCIELRGKLAGVLVGGTAHIDITNYVRDLAASNGYDPERAVELASRISVALK